MHMSTKLRKPRLRVHRRKGQSIVEFALGSILLVMLLATAIDLGRAFYTWQVVHQMASEAAAYLARYPGNDNTNAGQDTYQGRAINVGITAGKIFDKTKINTTTGIRASVPATARCMGTSFTVYIDYPMSDLFIPAFFGVKSLNLGAEETSAFLTSNRVPGNTCPP
jgi:Flp pilus assembly protein TadG